MQAFVSLPVLWNEYDSERVCQPAFSWECLCQSTRALKWVWQPAFAWEWNPACLCLGMSMSACLHLGMSLSANLCLEMSMTACLLLGLSTVCKPTCEYEKSLHASTSEYVLVRVRHAVCLWEWDCFSVRITMSNCLCQDMRYGSLPLRSWEWNDSLPLRENEMTVFLYVRMKWHSAFTWEWNDTLPLRENKMKVCLCVRIKWQAAFTWEWNDRVP